MSKQIRMMRSVAVPVVGEGSRGVGVGDVVEVDDNAARYLVAVGDAVYVDATVAPTRGMTTSEPEVIEHRAPAVLSRKPEKKR